MFLQVKEQYKQLFTSASHFQEIKEKLLVDHKGNLLQLGEFKDMCAANMTTIENLFVQGIYTVVVDGLFQKKIYTRAAIQASS